MTSTPAISAAPKTASTSPHQTAAGSCTPAARAASAVQIGVVVTSAIDAATVVIDRLGSHAAKCAARKRPATAELRRSRSRRPFRVARSRIEEDGQQGDRPRRVAPEGDGQERGDHQGGQRPREGDADDRDRHERDVPAPRPVQRPRLGGRGGHSPARGCGHSRSARRRPARSRTTPGRRTRSRCRSAPTAGPASRPAGRRRTTSRRRRAARSRPARRRCRGRPSRSPGPRPSAGRRRTRGRTRWRWRRPRRAPRRPPPRPSPSSAALSGTARSTAPGCTAR